jgi:hypothetical protein
MKGHNDPHCLKWGERRAPFHSIRKDKESLPGCQASGREVRIVHRRESLYPPAFFSLSDGTEPSIQEGESFSFTRENTGTWTANHRGRYTKGAGEACKRPLQPCAISWMDQVHQLIARTPGPLTGRPVVVMVQPTHDRNGNHLVPRILSVRNRSEPFRNLLSYPLMRSCLIEVGHIRASAPAGAASPERSTDGRGILV